MPTPRCWPTCDRARWPTSSRPPPAPDGSVPSSIATEIEGRDWERATVMARTGPGGERGRRGRGGAALPGGPVRPQPEPVRPAGRAHLGRWSGRAPLEVLGRVPFPPIERGALRDHACPYGFLWFDLAGRGSAVDLDWTRARTQALRTLVQAWLWHRPAGGGARRAADRDRRAPGRGAPPRPARAARRGGRVEGRLAHIVVGLRRPGDEPHFLRAGDEAGARASSTTRRAGGGVDALRDAELAPLVLAAVRGVGRAPGPVAVVPDDEGATVLAFGDRGTLSVFPWLRRGPSPRSGAAGGPGRRRLQPRPGPARALWRGGQDLGLVQEQLAGAPGGGRWP